MNHWQRNVDWTTVCCLAIGAAGSVVTLVIAGVRVGLNHWNPLVAASVTVLETLIVGGVAALIWWPTSE